MTEKNPKRDGTLEFLLELDGDIMVINADKGLWVKFDVKRATPTDDRPHGIKYSLSLHDKNNNRIMGFDNAHAIEYGAKTNVAAKRVYDHWHRDEKDSGHPYHYVNAAKLVEDFWIEVDRIELKSGESDQ